MELKGGRGRRADSRNGAAALPSTKLDFTLLVTEHTRGCVSLNFSLLGCVSLNFSTCL